jgi:hypothetical protein
MGIRRCAATAGAMTALLATGWAAPAQATIYERENFRFSESVEEELCGIAVRRDTTARGTLRVRTGKGDLDQAFFGSASVRFTDTFTNLETTASFSISGTGVFGKDIKATPLGDGIFAFKVQDSGTVVVRDGDGRVVLRGAGSWWSTIVFDSLGDSAPGGEVISETLGRVNGPHPGLEMDDDEFCAMVEDLIG